ncbi:MAG: fimbrillin family protein [Bacteroidales bacterium]|nr:fimbrillin family protein [Bacteroidales bacterium]
MKKVLIISAAAVLALVSCAKVQDVYTPEAQEIAFQAVTTPNTKAAVDGAIFTSDNMKVTAYDATAGAVYFDATSFTKPSSTWTGGKYWPLTPATINFLAIANANADNATDVTWGSNKADQVTIVMNDNSTAQRDLMFACGTGTVTQTSGQALSFPTNVPMTFYHAQSWIKFYVTAGNAATAGGLTINSITLNDVSCDGTFTVTHANWNKTKVQRDAAAPAGSLDGSVSGVWSAFSTNVDNIEVVKNAGWTFKVAGDDAEDYFYGSLMVVPNQGIASFTINYTLGGNTYNYTYTPTSSALAQATKYTYNITITLQEIVIAPTVNDWTEGGPTNITIPTV